MLAVWRWFETRLVPVHVFAAAACLLLVVHADALFDPPYWDTLVGPFPQGLWLARNGFDVVGLLTEQPTCPQGGPNVYPFSVYPLLVASLYAVELAPPGVFFVLHLVSIASAATCAAASYSIARRNLDAPLAVLATLTLVSAPLFQSLATQLNMDMPLCACTCLALDALDRQRCASAWGWALAALLVHPRGVVVVLAQCVAFGVCAVWPSRARRMLWSEPEAASRLARRWAAAHLGLLVLFGAELLLQAELSTMMPHVGAFAGFAAFVRTALVLLPEFGVLFGCAVIAALLGLRASAGWRAFHLACFVLAFLAFFGQVTTCLPRYFLQAYPHVLLILLGLLPRTPRATACGAGLLALAILANGINHAGRLYAPVPSGWSVPGRAAEGLPSNDGHVLERSMEYRDDLRLNLDIARHLEHLDRGRTVVAANWPLPYLLAVPEFGYVTRAWRTSSQNLPLSFDALGIPFRDLYDTSVRPYRKRLDVDVVWVLVPNVFVLPRLAVQPRIDVVTAVLERGEHRAFVLRRVGWEPR